jgi:hypothetical protein
VTGFTGEDIFASYSGFVDSDKGCKKSGYRVVEKESGSVSSQLPPEFYPLYGDYSVYRH